MRTLPRQLIAAIAGIAALAVTAPAVAHGSGAAHGMPGGGGAMGPGMMGGPDMMGQMGSDVMDLMGRWMSGRGQGNPGTGADAPTRRQMPAMPGQGMAPDIGGPRMPQMPGWGDEMPDMRVPGFQMQMAPGWSG